MHCVIGCPNKSNDPKCASMSWHRLCKNFEQINHTLPIPTRLIGCSELKHYRICDECHQIIKTHQPLKPPAIRKLIHMQVLEGDSLYRQELRDAIKHDHCYSLPPPTIPSSFVSTTSASDSMLVSSIPLPKLKDPIHFCIEMYENDDSAIACYTSFPSYHYLLVCYLFLGNAHLS